MRHTDQDEFHSTLSRCPKHQQDERKHIREPTDFDLVTRDDFVHAPSKHDFVSFDLEIKRFELIHNVPVHCAHIDFYRHDRSLLAVSEDSFEFVECDRHILYMSMHRRHFWSLVLCKPTPVVEIIYYPNSFGTYPRELDFCMDKKEMPIVPEETPDGPSLHFACPHCEQVVSVRVAEINCAIFRHGTYKDSLKPIDPHLCKDECDRLFASELIYGCGKPFQLVRAEAAGYTVHICGYI